MNELQKAVIEQLGFESSDYPDSEDLKANLEDIMNHGVDGGFSGFIYYTDTIEFFDNNRELILSELSDLADSVGESVIDVVRSFRCLQLDNGENWDCEIDQVLMSIKCDDGAQIKNALSWFAAEEVARQLIEE